jgi:hypothetical protein
MPWEDRFVIRTMDCCARCGDIHENVEVYRLVPPLGKFGFYCTCPTTGETVYFEGNSETDGSP